MNNPQTPSQAWHDEAMRLFYAYGYACEKRGAGPSRGVIAHENAERESAALAAFSAHLSARPQEGQAEAVFDLQGGLDNQELSEAWGKKLPGVKPSDDQLTAFALGIECGSAMASEKRAKADDYDRVADLARLRRVAMERAGVDPWVHATPPPPMSQEPQRFIVNLETSEISPAVSGEAEQLRAALAGVTDLYCRLINSGDAGNWDPEKEPEVIAARAALQGSEVPWHPV